MGTSVAMVPYRLRGRRPARPVSAASRRRTQRQLTTSIALLAAANVARATLLPAALHLPFNVALAGGFTVAVRRSGMTAEELGTTGADAGRGLGWGLAAGGCVAAVVAAAAIAPPAAGSFDDERAAVDLGRLLFDVGVRIPLGTVLLEELAFRGVVLGLLGRLLPAPKALAASAALFGLWHVLPPWNGGGGAVLDRVAGSDTTVLLATLVATSGAGFVFGWLRLRSGSLLAPLVAHHATNTLPLTAAWLLGGAR